MKILILSQYFWPESFRINDLADEFIKRGHSLTVLTGKPNYPTGNITHGYKWWGINKEKRNGYTIIRVPLIPRGSASGLRLAINYISFVFFSSLYILTHRLKFDVSITFAISPITQVYAALLHKRIFRSKSYIWVQDLWPESVSAVGKVSNGLIIKILNKMVRNIYNNVDGILVQSKAFIDSICKIGNYGSKIFYIPNWAEDLFLSRKLSDKTKYATLMPEGFKIVFAGNIGEAQDFESILKAAEYTINNKFIKWIIIGDGRSKNAIQEKVKVLNLNNIIFLGRYPVEDMPNLFIHADALLVTLKDTEIFAMTIPSKIQSYMAFGKPIVTMLNGTGNKIIKEANCGLVADSGNYKQLAENVIKMSRLDSVQLSILSKNSNNYYLNNFSKDLIISKLITIMEQ